MWNEWLQAPQKRRLLFCLTRMIMSGSQSKEEDLVQEVWNK